MLGVFDSGRGGRNALATLRALAPTADIAFLADTKNAPYGTKSTEALCRLVAHDIRRLREVGATHILVACCTASCIYAHLPRALRVGVYPILRPTVAAAVRESRTRRYAILATEATVRAGYFARLLTERQRDAHTVSLSAPRLVTLAEEERTSLSDRAVREVLTPLCEAIAAADADTVILGCTHFSPFAAPIGELLPSVRCVASAEEGARAFARALPPACLLGSGRTLDIS